MRRRRRVTREPPGQASPEHRPRQRRREPRAGVALGLVVEHQGAAGGRADEGAAARAHIDEQHARRRDGDLRREEARARHADGRAQAHAGVRRRPWSPVQVLGGRAEGEAQRAARVRERRVAVVHRVRVSAKVARPSPMSPPPTPHE